MAPEELLTISEAAARMHVSRQTIYSWIHEGKVKPLLTPGGRQRIPESQLFLGRPPEFVETKGDSYQVFDISELEPSRTEYAGSKEKNWFSRDDRHWFWDMPGEEFLFKAGREHTGENWAEKVVCELCRLLDLPHAEYELAVYRGKRGVVSPNFVLTGDDLVLGNEILGKTVPGYEKIKRYDQRKHTVLAVLAAVSLPGVYPPKGWTSRNGITKAADVFLGYLLLDAWIGNTDRHHENWGLILDARSRCYYLAPTFDHASSLGRNESDGSRRERLTTRDRNRTVKAFAERAKSALYAAETESRPLTTYQAFRQAAKYRQEAARAWLGVMETVSQTSVERAIGMIPKGDISDVGREFAKKLLEENKSRLLALRS